MYRVHRDRLDEDPKYILETGGCASVLALGYDIFRYDSESTFQSSLTQWLYTAKFSEIRKAVKAGLALSVPGLPFDIGIDFDEAKYEKLVEFRKSGSIQIISSSEMIHIFRQSANAHVVSSWLECMKMRNQQCGIQIVDDYVGKLNGDVKLRYNFSPGLPPSGLIQAGRLRVAGDNTEIPVSPARPLPYRLYNGAPDFWIRFNLPSRERDIYLEIDTEFGTITRRYDAFPKEIPLVKIAYGTRSIVSGYQLYHDQQLRIGLQIGTQSDLLFSDGVRFDYSGPFSYAHPMRTVAIKDDIELLVAVMVPPSVTGTGNWVTLPPVSVWRGSAEQLAKDGARGESPQIGHSYLQCAPSKCYTKILWEARGTVVAPDVFYELERSDIAAVETAGR